MFNIVNTFTNFCIGGGKKEFENEKITVIVRFHEIFALWKKEEEIQVLTYFDETFAVLKTTQKVEWFQSVLYMKLEWWYFHEKKKNNFIFSIF